MLEISGSFGFIFTYDLDTCKMDTFEGFAGLENGIKAVYTDGSYDYVFVGYDLMD